MSTAAAAIELEIEPGRVYYLRFWLEAHGHLAWFTATGPGRVRLLTSAGNVPRLTRLLREEARRLGLRGLRLPELEG